MIKIDIYGAYNPKGNCKKVFLESQYHNALKWAFSRGYTLKPLYACDKDPT